MITLAQQPNAGALYAAYRPVPFVVEQTEVPTTLPPALEVQVRRSEAMLTTYPVGVSRRVAVTGAFRYELNMGGVCAPHFDKTAGLPTPGLTRLRKLPGSVFGLRVRFDEHAPSTEGLLLPTGQFVESATCWVIDAYRREDDLDQTVADYGRPRNPRFLTRRPRERYWGIASRDTLSIVNPYMVPGESGGVTYDPGELRARFRFLREDGSLISENEITLSTTPGDFVQLPCGPADLLGLTWTTGTALTTLDNLHHYTVEAGRMAGVSRDNPTIQFLGGGDVHTIYVGRAPSRRTRVHFYNSFGAWEVAEFPENETRRLDLGGTTYARPGLTLTQQRSARGAVEFQHSTMSRAEADWMADLATSQVVYLERDERLLHMTLDASVLPIAYGPGSDGEQPFRFTLRSAAITQSQRAY